MRLEAYQIAIQYSMPLNQIRADSQNQWTTAFLSAQVDHVWCGSGGRHGELISNPAQDHSLQTLVTTKQTSDSM